jgi:hypothetical protein
VHRHVKPGNIMLTRSGAKLLDFGLAKLHPAANAVTGLSIANTVSSDLFAFGAVLYEMAFESNETGRYEIYIQPFPAGAKTPVSSGGGAQVRWNRNGRELFYIAMDGQLMSVPMTLTGARAEIGKVAPLFRTNVGGAVSLGVSRQQYAVSSDSQRFLMNAVAVEANASPISLILGWKGGRQER